MKTIITIIFVVLSHIGFAQNEAIFSYEDFIDQIKTNHPVMNQLNLLDFKSEAYALKAKGELDPTIDLYWDRKSFDDKNYFSKLDGQLKIPTRRGIDIVAGYENNNGQFLNDENSLPDSGLLMAGISVPIGSGLLYDDRRRVLDEAKLIAKENKLKQIESYNKLIYKASASYLDWQNSYQQVQVYEEAILIADETFTNTRELYDQGVGTAVDTLEALLNLDQQNASLLAAKQAYNATRQLLNIFLWGADNTPLELNEDIYPEVLTEDKWLQDVLDLRIDQATQIAELTTILNLSVDRSRLILDKKLEKEFLKPSLNIKYNPIFRVNENNRLLNYTTSDYKAGVDLYYPLFNRKTRGNIKLLDLDIENLDLMIPQIERDIIIQIETLIQNQTLLEQRLQIAKNNMLIATKLLEAETIKFDLGESSLFLMNARQQKRVSLDFKVLDITNKILKNRLKHMEILQAFWENN